MGAPFRTLSSLPLSPGMWEKGGAVIYSSHTEGLPRHPDQLTFVHGLLSLDLV